MGSSLRTLHAGPFHRALFAISMVQAAMALPDLAARQSALAGIPAYKSRGKGKTRLHPAGGHLKQRRAAQKRRNVIRNRRAHRG